MEEASPFPFPQLCLALQFPTQSDSILLRLHPIGNSLLPPPETMTNHSMFQTKMFCTCFSS